MAIKKKAIDVVVGDVIESAAYAEVNEVYSAYQGRRVVFHTTRGWLKYDADYEVTVTEPRGVMTEGGRQLLDKELVDDLLTERDMKIAHLHSELEELMHIMQDRIKKVIKATRVGPEPAAVGKENKI